MVVSRVAAASAGPAGIRRFPEDVGMGSAARHREGATGDAAALSSKRPSGCRAGGGTGDPTFLGEERTGRTPSVIFPSSHGTCVCSLNWAPGFIQLAICSLVRHSLRLFLEYIGLP